MDLVQQLALKEFRLSQRGGGSMGNLDGLQREFLELQSSMDSLVAKSDLLKDEIVSLETGMQTMREDFLKNRRSAIAGKTFAEFTTWKGRTYREVSISSVDDGGVTIRHADGSARVTFADLNEDQRMMFGLDAQLAMAAIEKEKADAIEYDQWIGSKLAANRAAKEKLAKLSAASVPKVRPRSRASDTTIAANVNPLTKPSSEVSSRYSSRYTRSRPTYYYYPYIPAYRNPCSPMISYINRSPERTRWNPYTPNRTRTNR